MSRACPGEKTTDPNSTEKDRGKNGKKCVQLFKLDFILSLSGVPDRLENKKKFFLVPLRCLFAYALSLWMHACKEKKQTEQWNYEYKRPL